MWAKIKWILDKRPVLTYEGFVCTHCKKWISSKFSIPTYKSDGRFWDTWRICQDCKKMV